jgi:hypothetical protein
MAESMVLDAPVVSLTLGPDVLIEKRRNSGYLFEERQAGLFVEHLPERGHVRQIIVFRPRVGKLFVGGRAVFRAGRRRQRYPARPGQRRRHQ